MALFVECPKCRKRNSADAASCKCGFNIKKAAHKIYWIEYYFSGKRKRERIGPSKAAAEQRHREVLKRRTEERFIDKNKNARVTFDELAAWYLSLPQITGHAFGDPALVPHVRHILEQAREEGDERLEQLAERFLRRAGVTLEE